MCAGRRPRWPVMQVCPEGTLVWSGRDVGCWCGRVIGDPRSLPPSSFPPSLPPSFPLFPPSSSFLLREKRESRPGTNLSPQSLATFGARHVLLSLFHSQTRCVRSLFSELEGVRRKRAVFLATWGDLVCSPRAVLFRLCATRVARRERHGLSVCPASVVQRDTQKEQAAEGWKSPSPLGSTAKRRPTHSPPSLRPPNTTRAGLTRTRLSPRTTQKSDQPNTGQRRKRNPRPKNKKWCSSSTCATRRRS